MVSKAKTVVQVFSSLINLDAEKGLHLCQCWIILQYLHSFCGYGTHSIGTIKCDVSTIICDVGTIQCDIGTIQCDISTI